MTQAHQVAHPEWTVGDRMRKAMENADVPVQEIADYLGVGRNTVSRWINNHGSPSIQTLRLWALRTGTECGTTRPGTRSEARRVGRWELYRAGRQWDIDHGSLVCPECVRAVLDRLVVAMFGGR